MDTEAKRRILSGLMKQGEYMGLNKKSVDEFLNSIYPESPKASHEEKVKVKVTKADRAFLKSIGITWGSK